MVVLQKQLNTFLRVKILGVAKQKNRASIIYKRNTENTNMRRNQLQIIDQNIAKLKRMNEANAVQKSIKIYATSNRIPVMEETFGPMSDVSENYKTVNITAYLEKDTNLPVGIMTFNGNTYTIIRSSCERAFLTMFSCDNIDMFYLESVGNTIYLKWKKDDVQNVVFELTNDAK